MISSKTVQTITYLPHFISWVVLAGLFRTFITIYWSDKYDNKSCRIKPIYFVADPEMFRSFLVTTGIWKGFGWGSIIYLAAIK